MFLEDMNEEKNGGLVIPKSKARNSHNVIEDSKPLCNSEVTETPNLFSPNSERDMLKRPSLIPKELEEPVDFMAFPEEALESKRHPMTYNKVIHLEEVPDPAQNRIPTESEAPVFLTELEDSRVSCCNLGRRSAGR